MNTSVPKNSSNSPTAGVTKASTGMMTLGAEGAAFAPEPKTAPPSEVSAESGSASTESARLILPSISGARPIHSPTGPAIIVAARPSSKPNTVTINVPVSQGGMPKRLARLTKGESMVAITAAPSTGIKIGSAK